jgi:hypothetical protein
LAIKHLAERHVERFERKFPANSAVMGKELPRSIGALWKIHGIVVKRVKINGNDNGIEISKVSRGRHFPTPDEGPEKEETEEPEDDFFSGAPGTKILGTPAYPTQDEPEPEPPKPQPPFSIGGGDDRT